jgi:hypothetical protein
VSDSEPEDQLAAATGEADEAVEPAREPRPLIERIGLAGIALVLAVLFGGVSAASWVGGEPFLAVMAGIGCLMTLWVGALTLVRG